MDEYITMPIRLKTGRIVYTTLLKDMTEDEWKHFLDYIEVMKLGYVTKNPDS